MKLTILKDILLKILCIGIICFLIMTILFKLYTNYKLERESAEMQRVWEEYVANKQREKDSIEAAKLEKKRLLDSTMIGNVTVIGDIKLGQTEAEYKAAVHKIKKELGYSGIKINDVKFLLTSPKYYKEKLYSVTLLYEDKYFRHNIGPSITGYGDCYKYDDHINLGTISLFLKNKYIMSDSLSSFGQTIYTFSHKRICWEIKCNIKYGTEINRLATITFEDPKITDLLENQRLEIIKQEELRKLNEKERKEKERKLQKDEQKRKEEELLKTM